MKNLTKFYLIPVFVLSALIGCGKKGGGGSNPPPTTNGPLGQNCNMTDVAPAGYQCVNGQWQAINVAGQSLLNNVQFDASYMSGKLSIIATPNSGSNLNLSHPEAIYFYSGPIRITGTMNVQSTLCIYGQTPPTAGLYTLNGTGMISGGVITQISLTGTGPTHINFLTNAIPFCKKASP